MLDKLCFQSKYWLDNKSCFTFYNGTPYSLVGDASQVQPFFFHNEPIWLAHDQKKVEIMEASQCRRFYGKKKCLALWPSYIGEKGRTLGNTYGIKAKMLTIGNTLGEHIGNSLATGREQVRNKGKKKKNPSPPPKT